MAHTTSTDSSLKQGFAAGTSIAAAVLLLVVGVLSILEGISAAASDDLVIVDVNDYVYKLNTTGWGWIHIILGAIVVIAAIGLMAGTTWGRAAAMILAALSIIANFLWLPYYPIWSIVIIALDVVIIWAVATWKPDAV
ncbi:DUF7144 family membrane protein [Nocardia otitidiscaviarum]|uniref:DUF7144 domain-containing protein n=1 Tax=Nocardia otitidiscaviarum TaxID=1823 RepID=A0A516NK42_9NOCA|nr:hypothetical protein [Nocardia otitidiscaviarum]MBF6180314.1 hypothetical protein [Nocardia otitidiscaviarum]MBF6239417.1 hypothetical protein [Nocardia otitidiscaviarum]MCP9619338.1 hypothetical protein [Nocardia otitidiscaviarum]QDP79267.1 hypothetical protein FOH10_11595 [Nocardia otitidiscaviarum]